MNWTVENYKHYSAEHLHKTDKVRLAAEQTLEGERFLKLNRQGKRSPRNRK